MVKYLILSRILVLFLPLLFWQLNGRADVGLNAFPGVWNKWDAPHYVYIADNGYTNVGDEANFIVFQPLYPLLTALTSILGGNTPLAGIIVSNVFFVLGCIVMLNIAPPRVVFLLSIFPTAFFFSAPYTESLFFFLTVLSFALLQNQKWFRTSLSGALAVLTRHVGLLLLFPILYQWYKHKNKRLLDLLKIFLPFIISFSLYLLINYKIYGNPFAFSEILKNHWQKSFSFPWNSLINSWRVALSPMSDYTLQVGIWEAVPATLALFLIPFSFKYLKRHLAIYYSVYVLFILSTSFLLSTPRYLLSVFPLFILLEKLLRKNKYAFYLWSLVSILLLGYFSTRFVSGQWAF